MGTDKVETKLYKFVDKKGLTSKRKESLKAKLRVMYFKFDISLDELKENYNTVHSDMSWALQQLNKGGFKDIDKNKRYDIIISVIPKKLRAQISEDMNYSRWNLKDSIEGVFTIHRELDSEEEQKSDKKEDDWNSETNGVYDTDEIRSAVEEQLKARFLRYKHYRRKFLDSSKVKQIYMEIGDCSEQKARTLAENKVEEYERDIGKYKSKSVEILMEYVDRKLEDINPTDYEDVDEARDDILDSLENLSQDKAENKAERIIGSFVDGAIGSLGAVSAGAVVILGLSILGGLTGLPFAAYGTILMGQMLSGFINVSLLG